MQNTTFSGSAPGLSVAASSSYLVDGVAGYVTQLTRGIDAALFAVPVEYTRRGASNQSLLSQQVADGTDPVGVGRRLRVAYPAQSCSPGDTYQGDTPATAALAGQARPAGGTQLFCGLPRRARRASLRYAFKIPAGFDFRRGGKLPGLSTANTSATGSYQPGVTGVTSFTCRHMWQTGGLFTTYYYLLDGQSRWGTDYGVDVTTVDAYVVEGWNELQTEVWVNDVGASNGGCVVTLNGTTVADRSDLLFRATESLTLDGVLFSTFFGGNTGGVGSHDDTYETMVDTYIDFSDLYISVVQAA